ncbi:MAG: sensor histidine kinase [Nitrospiraceae bacterium]
MRRTPNIEKRLSAWILNATVMIVGVWFLTGCASQSPLQPKTILEAGLNVVRLEQDPDSGSNSHPAKLTPSEVSTLLRGVRAWERRNFIHRVFVGEAPRTRAFRDDEIPLLAPALSRALAQAGPSERIYFHLSSVTETGEEETTTGWLSVRDPVLYLSLSEVHDRHGPGPDISKYDRQMPNVPEISGAFDVIFEPEESLVKVSSAGRFWAPDQREELQIRYREALSSMPVHPLGEAEKKPLQSQPELSPHDLPRIDPSNRSCCAHAAARAQHSGMPLCTVVAYAMRRTLLGWSERLTIGQKLVVAFGLILILLAGSLTAILIYLSRINSYVDRHKRITVPAIVTAATMQRHAFEMNLMMHFSTETTTLRSNDATMQRLTESTAQLGHSLALYRSTHAARTHPVLFRMLTDHHQVSLADQEDRALAHIDLVVRELSSHWKAWLVQPAGSAERRQEMALGKADILFEQLMDGLDQLVDAHTKIDVEMKHEGDRLLGHARLIALGLVVLLALIISATYFLVSRQVARPLQRLAVTADQVARHNLGASFEPWAAQDEVGNLTRSLDTMLATLRERSLALERKTKELEAFTYSVAHDLKSPLREIEGFSSLLQKKWNEVMDQTAKDYVEKIHASSLWMAALIDALLRYSRIEQQSMPMVRVNLRSLVQDVVADRTHSVSHPLPTIVVDILLEDISGDPATLRQVLINLLDNAIKFSREVQAPEITIGGKTTADETLLWIRDNGIGFDPKDAEKIFGLFARLHGQQDYEGTGLGLAIVKLIMSKHNGRVWGESSPGKGSTFYLAFPK